MDLLDFAQIKAGKFRKSVKKFNIREVINQVIMILKSKVDELKLTLDVDFQNFLEVN